MENPLTWKLGQVHQGGILCVSSSRYPAVPGVRSALRRHRQRICGQPPRRGRAGGCGGRSAHEAPAEPRAASGSGCHLLVPHPPLRAGDAAGRHPWARCCERRRRRNLTAVPPSLSRLFAADEALKKARSVALRLHRRWSSATRMYRNLELWKREIFSPYKIGRKQLIFTANICS